MSAGIVSKIAAIAGLTGLGIALNGLPAQAQEFGSPELIAAAKAEGKLMLYTANFAEVEQDVIKAFNKRFPEIKVEMVRAPGGQLITRVRTPPKTWMDLTKPQYDALTGQVFAQSGGTNWTRIMFEGQVLGEDYWAK